MLVATGGSCRHLFLVYTVCGVFYSPSTGTKSYCIPLSTFRGFAICWQQWNFNTTLYSTAKRKRERMKEERLIACAFCNVFIYIFLYMRSYRTCELLKSSMKQHVSWTPGDVILTLGLVMLSVSWKWIKLYSLNWRLNSTCWADELPPKTFTNQKWMKSHYYL